MQLTQRIATYHKHVQSTPSTTWTIVHNLYSYPIVDVFIENDGAQVKIMPSSVTHIDNKTVSITFTSARAGVAMVS